MFFLVLFSAGLVSATVNKRETSGLQILDYSCTVNKSDVLVGSITTGPDEGKIRYSVTFEGGEEFAPVCSVLRTLKENGEFVSLRIYAETPAEGDIHKAKLDALVLRPVAALSREKRRETSHVKINKYACDIRENEVMGTVLTGPDLGGAYYSLEFDGKPFINGAICRLLESLKTNQDYVTLRIYNETPAEGDLYKARLDAIVVAPYND
jgi:hypothetical protein